MHLHTERKITEYHATKKIQTEEDSKCRLCKQFYVTVEHTISAFPISAKEQHVKRHDGVCAQLHFNMCKNTGVKLNNKHWYDHVPKSVETSHGSKVAILWNQQVQTDRTVPNNKPDIIKKKKKKGKCMLIDVAISGDGNVFKKEADKVLKYKDFITEILRMSNVKAKVIPVLTVATGTISKSHRQYFSNIPGNNEIKELQKTAILGTAHTTESANVKVQNTFRGRNYITCSTICKYRTAATLNTIDTCFSRVYNYNTLRKGDNKDDDDDDNNNKKRMWNVKTRVIPVTLERLGNHL
jgi:hypothetical protein